MNEAVLYLAKISVHDINNPKRVAVFKLSGVKFNLPPFQLKTKISRFEPMFERMQKGKSKIGQDISYQILNNFLPIALKLILLFIFGKNLVFWTKFQVEVAVSPANIKPRIKLLEYILLNMDFSYLDTVPSVNTLMFKLPNK